MRLTIALALCILAVRVGTAQQANGGGKADSTRSTRSGVYSAGQAAQGGELYALICLSCHNAAFHTAPAFVAKWDGRPVAALYEFIRAEMPKNDPGGLTRKEYLLVTAYLLKLNGMPAGPAELPADSLALAKIRLDLKAGGPPQ